MLYITEKVKHQIIEAGILGFPQAGFGFLLGFEKRDIRIIEKIVLIDSYEATGLKEEDQLNAALQAAENGLSVLGIFFTLPNKPATPDFIDAPGLPDYYSILLLSVWGGDFVNLQSWRRNRQYKTVEEKIAIVNDPNYEPIIINTGNPFSLHYN